MDKNLNKNDVEFEEVSQFPENVAVVSEDIDFIPEEESQLAESEIEELNDDINIVSEVYEIIDGMDSFEEESGNIKQERSEEGNISAKEREVEDEIDIIVHDEDFLSEPESVSDIEKLALEIDDMTTINDESDKEDNSIQVSAALPEQTPDKVKKQQKIAGKKFFFKDINDFSLLSSEGFEGIPANELVNKLKAENESDYFLQEQKKVKDEQVISDGDLAGKEQLPRVTIDIPEEVADKLPDDFEIKPVDLKAAETIAQEEISFADEEDLLHELESIELKLVSDDDEEDEELVIQPVKLKKTIPAEKLKVTYILPENNSLTADEKNSIESDLSSNISLVIEEDVNDISERLNKMQDDQFDLSKTGKKMQKEQEPDLIDITDKIVVIEDKDDLDRFIDTIPEVKKEDMKKLLNYLDGLFEKLPEEVIRTFANSEYFDLYSSALKDLRI